MVSNASTAIPRIKTTEQLQKSSTSVKTYRERMRELFGENGNTRLDGRKLTDHRRIYMKLSTLSEMRGSSYVEMGRTKVICGVEGPYEIPNLQKYTEDGLLDCNFKFTLFAGNTRRTNFTEVEERHLALRLQKTLEPVVCRHEFPNLQLSIRVTVIENDGSCLAAAVTAASLALADSGLPMFDLVSGVSIGVHGEKRITDVSSGEEEFCQTVTPQGSNKNHATVSIAYLESLEQVSDIYLDGDIEEEVIGDLVEEAIEYCKEVTRLQQQVILKKKVKQVHFPEISGGDNGT